MHLHSNEKHHHDEAHHEEAFGDLFVHQLIETIEFVLGNLFSLSDLLTENISKRIRISYSFLFETVGTFIGSLATCRSFLQVHDWQCNPRWKFPHGNIYIIWTSSKIAVIQLDFLWIRVPSRGNFWNSAMHGPNGMLFACFASPLVSFCLVVMSNTLILKG